jgi:hypothetical protein
MTKIKLMNTFCIELNGVIMKTTILLRLKTKNVTKIKEESLSNHS